MKTYDNTEGDYIYSVYEDDLPMRIFIAEDAFEEALLLRVIGDAMRKLGKWDLTGHGFPPGSVASFVPATSQDWKDGQCQGYVQIQRGPFDAMLFLSNYSTIPCVFWVAHQSGDIRVFWDIQSSDFNLTPQSNYFPFPPVLCEKGFTREH